MMQTVRTVFLAAAAALFSFAYGAAAPKSSQAHVMTIRLPGGAVEEIHYTGNVPPRVVLSRNAAPFAFGWPVAFFDADSPFAELSRISAEMDRQMDLMIGNAQTLAAQPGLITEVDGGKLPPGSHSYTFVSTMSGNGVCEKSLEVTSRGDGQRPQVMSKSWGDCGKARDGASMQEPQRDQPSDIREIRYNAHRPTVPQVREASLY